MTEKKQVIFSLLILFALALVFIGPKTSPMESSMNDLRSCRHNKGRIECEQKAPVKDKLSTTSYYLREDL